MKVFKFYCDEFHYVFAAETKELAIEEFKEQTGDLWDSIEEIPESKWDEKIISIYEDNDLEKETWKTSIRDIICGNEPQLVCTNDDSYF